MGIIVADAATFDLPVDVSIDAGSIGGPSAGLAFALGIVDELGDDIDHGRTVVVTGELALDGTVLPIGGIKQKTIGAKEAGADIFIVPDANAEEARKYADGLEIVAVSTFDEALAALREALVFRRENARPEPCGICVFFVAATLHPERPRAIGWATLAYGEAGGKSPAKTAIFRQAALCALADGPCPTFRSAQDGPARAAGPAAARRTDRRPARTPRPRGRP